MLTYTFECLSCGNQFEREMSIKECDTPQTCECGGASKKIVVLNETGFILSGDGWASKDMRTKAQMTERGRKAGRRSKGIPTPKLVPNVEGEQVDSWSEAKKLAASKGKNATSYDPLVQKEG